MQKKYKVAWLALTIIILIPCVLIGYTAFRIGRIRKGFPSVETGQSRQTIVDLMGDASEIRSCNFTVQDRSKNFTGNCFEIFVYRGVSDEWAVAFDKDGKVIEKYYWFLGEYGKRPPDLDAADRRN